MTETTNKQKTDVRKLGVDSDTHEDPLLDCLALLAKLEGRPVTRTTLSAGLPLVQNRLTVELFPRAANRAGLSVRVLRRALEDLSNLELPAILLLDSGAACVAVSVNKEEKSIKVLLPQSGMGEQEFSIDELNESYSGFTIFARPKFKSVQKRMDDFEALPDKDWFWGTLASSWRIYRDALVASLLINIFALASPFFILNVYDRVVPNQAFETLWVLAIGMGIIYLFDLLIRTLRAYFIDIAGKKAELRLSAMLFEKVMGLKMESRPKSVGAFSKNLQEFDSVRDFITSFSVTALIDLPFALLGMLAIWYLAGPMVWVHILSILILAAFAFFIQKPLKKAVEKTYQASALKSSTVIEGLSGIEEIKTLGAEGQIQNAMEESVGYIAKWNTISRLFTSSVAHVSALVQNLSVVAVVIIGVYMIANGNLTQGGLIACVILSRRVTGPMTQVLNLTTRYHRARTALEKLNSIMQMPEERPPGRSFLHRAAIRGEIDFKNVTFSYPGQLGTAMKNVSFHIEAGERVGIIGQTGSGKSTLGKLLLSLYEPNTGTIAVDDTDIRQIDPAELRRFIGYVPQDISLFRGSVRDNIIFGTHDVTDDAVLFAADVTGVSDFIKDTAMGFDLQVGERGKQLSGGQRQSVALARAILLDPPLLVFDEPSSAMDNTTESKLINRLDKIIEGKTLLVISHRASVLALVDRVIVMHQGAVVADGPKAQVIEALKSGKLVS